MIPPDRNPSLGAIPGPHGVRFQVWAPKVREVLVVPEGTHSPFPLTRDADGFFRGISKDLATGDGYRYSVDGQGPFPDPASRFQPGGVHGPSRVIDPSRFRWSDEGWSGIPAEELVIHELHVGTFTPEGTFAAATARLPDLADLGVTAIELMPVADFPGRRGWGYDGVNLFAPARCYGEPDDLRRLIDEAHRLGLAVLLDVVYNHLGPDGNYLAQFSEFYVSPQHQSAWGPAINLDGDRSGPVRAFLIENALAWLHEYHFDGLRLDATHHLFDASPTHFLAELADRVRESIKARPIHLIAEDPRNLKTLLLDKSQGGYGLDGIWSDDFHHEFRRYLLGDDEGVFRDFRGRLDDLATTINDGWLVRGAYSIHRQYRRGTDPVGILPRQVVFTIQNHDRIGNRAFGERLNHQVDAATFRAASALLLFLPATPLLFMGQEWAASSPFLFFTDHKAELGDLIREGRRHEFRHYAAFADPRSAAELPDLQVEATFLRCKLDWSERTAEPHASILRLYRVLLHLRRAEPSLRVNQVGKHRALALNEETLLVRRDAEEGCSLALIVRFRGPGRVELRDFLGDFGDWEIVLTTEDPAFSPDPALPTIEPGSRVVNFARASAVLLRSVPSGRIAADPGDQSSTPQAGP